MLQTIRSFPEQFLPSWDASLTTALPNKITGTVYLCGMGGSAIPGELINDHALGQHPLVIVRDYALPPQVNQNDLIICSSYSGNTEETLSVFSEAITRKLPLLVLTHGGKLAALADQHHIAKITIPDCIQPRCAVGHFFASLSCLLHRLNRSPITRADLENLAGFLKSQNAAHEKKGQEMAQRIKGKIPIILAPSFLLGTAMIWKIKFNENCKTQSFYNVVPEMNHNEMIGYTNPIAPLHFIFLLDPDTHPRVKRRMEVMEELLGDKASFETVAINGDNLLQRIFDAHGLADFASYYLALEYGVDPAPVPMIEIFKKKLG